MNKKKIMVIIVLGVLVLSVLLNLFKNRITAFAAERMLAQRSGFEVEIEKIHFSLLRSRLDIQGFSLKNPEVYNDPDAVEIARLLIDYRWTGLLGNELHLEEVDLQFNRFTVVTMADGRNNMVELRENLNLEKEATSTDEAEPRQPSTDGKKTPHTREAEAVHDKQIFIDRLTIYLGEVTYREYDATGRAEAATFTIDNEYKYSDVRELDTIAAAMGSDIAIRTMPQIIKDLQNPDGSALEKLGDRLNKAFKGMF